MAAYTAKDIDGSLSDFETTASKLLAVKDSMVKRQAAEKNLLVAAEKGRDFMAIALKGDKHYLAEVYGDTAERIVRYRSSYDSLAELGLEKDQRWGHLSERIKSVEAVIADIGSFKPRSRATEPAPESLKYKGWRARMSPRRSIRLQPILTGGECSFTLEGDVPEGLKLDKESGEITGVIADTVPEVKFNVIAKNDKGEVKTEVKFAVSEPPPKGLKYPSLQGNLLVGSAVVFQPQLDAGEGRGFKVSPALPDGLELDVISGIISGTPAMPMDPMQFEITAINPGGESKVTVEFGAVIPPPDGLHYPNLPEEFAVGQSVNFGPELGDGIPTEFSVTPALPDGLVLDKCTGVIRGAPTTPTDKTSYTIVAGNDGGKTSVTLAFVVKSTAPSSLSYSGTADSFTNTTMANLIPKVEGGKPTSYSVEPPLPEGLVLSATTGDITGIPTELCESRTYVVTASNVAGSCAAELSFAVTRAPPSSLSYPSLVPVYAAGRPMELQPCIEGAVNEYVVSPPLPEGITLDAATGAISGTPPAATVETEYEVTARNEVGSTSTKFTFCTKVMPPTSLAYPSADDLYSVGESVNLVPQVEGGVDSFSVSPALPAGLTLDPATGIVSGSLEDVSDSTDYVFTASNEGGQITSTVTFQVNPCAPTSVAYPDLGQILVVGEEVEADPEIDAGAFTFSVTPALPDGLTLDEKTGRISGKPSTDGEEGTYRIEAKNVSGSVSTEVAFQVLTPGEVYITPNFANVLEEITDVAELLAQEPPKDTRYGDWMIWMVHRAFLNDPTLTELNFNNHNMPLPYEEWRVAPKLMKALETNTHLEMLSLAMSNLQKPQGHELAAVLKNNSTLKVVNVESNKLDSSCLTEIAEAIASNPNTEISQLRVGYQIGMGKFFGRPVEKAFGEMLQKNETITKLGLVVDDRHWMNCINQYTMRNIDYARRRRKKKEQMQGKDPEDLLPCKDHTLSRVHLEQPPRKPMTELLPESDVGVSGVFNQYLVKNKMVPSPTQLQAFARGAGQQIKFSELKPTIEQCRLRLLKAATSMQMTVIDDFNKSDLGKLSKFQISGTAWTMEVIVNGTRLICKSTKEPGIAISPAWAAWLQGEVPNAETDTKDDQTMTMQSEEMERTETQKSTYSQKDRTVTEMSEVF